MTTRPLDVIRKLMDDNPNATEAEVITMFAEQVSKNKDLLEAVAWDVADVLYDKLTHDKLARDRVSRTMH
jgi:hypothetical protein